MRILKYTITDTCANLSIPSTRTFLKCSIQLGDVVVWFMVDETSEPKNVQFRLFATGEQLPRDIKETTYLDTVQFSSRLVFHVFMQES